MRYSPRQQQGRGATKKPLCPSCEENYLRACYIQKQTEDRKSKWVKVGLYCDKCGHFENVT